MDVLATCEHECVHRHTVFVVPPVVTPAVVLAILWRHYVSATRMYNSISHHGSSCTSQHTPGARVYHEAQLLYLHREMCIGCRVQQAEDIESNLSNVVNRRF
jgi:hypothetical protein